MKRRRKSGISLCLTLIACIIYLLLPIGDFNPRFNTQKMSSVDAGSNMHSLRMALRLETTDDGDMEVLNQDQSPSSKNVDEEITVLTKGQNNSKANKSPKKQPQKSPMKSPKKDSHGSLQKVRSPKKSQLVETRVRSPRKKQNELDVSNFGETYQSEPSSSFRRGSRHLSLFGVSIENNKLDTTLTQLMPDEPGLPQGIRAHVRNNYAPSDFSGDSRKSVVETAILRFEGTFPKSIMHLTERLELLTTKWKKLKIKEPIDESRMKQFVSLVQYLSTTNICIAELEKCFEPRTIIPSDTMEPDTALEALVQAKFLINKLTPRFNSLTGYIGSAKSMHIALDLLINPKLLSDIDVSLSNTLQVISELSIIIRNSS